MFVKFLTQIANLFFVISFSLVKLLSQSVPIETIMLFRFIAGPIYLIPFFLFTKKRLQVKSIKLFVLRIVFGVSAMSCLFLSFKYGQIGKNMLIFECSTIWTLIYGYFVYKNKPHQFSLATIPFAFIGIYLILQPEKGLDIGTLYALLGSILNTGVFITLKELRSEHDTTTVVLVSYFFSSLILMIPNTLSFPDLTINSTLILWSMCSIGFIGQCLMTLGFKFATAGISSLLMLSIIPLTTLSGIIFFNETYTSIVWVGVALILSSLIIISHWQ